MKGTGEKKEWNEAEWFNRWLELARGNSGQK
jgi:hypothetical protein